MRTFNGKVAAITGAGSGIGRALAQELARRGTHLALSDVDQDGLDETVRLVVPTGVKVTAQTVDVADRDAVHGWADAVAADHGIVNLIINNAGVTVVAPVGSVSYQDFEWLMNINFWGVVHGTKAFLPYLRASGNGHVVNISSVFGLVSIPSQSTYNSAKFAVRGFTDALRIELDIEQCGVSATTIHPGGIKTNIVRNARVDEATGATKAKSIADFDKAARTTPEQAAIQILRAVEKNRRRATIGLDGRIFDLVSRLPALVPQRILVAVGRRQNR